MHARLITLDDELLLYVEIKRLMKGDQEATQLTSRRAQCKTGSSPASHRAHVEALPRAFRAAAMPSMREVCWTLVRRLTSCGVVFNRRASSAGRTCW